MQPIITDTYLNYPDIPKEIIITDDDGATQVKRLQNQDKTRVDKLYGKDHDTFRNDDDFDGII